MTENNETADLPSLPPEEVVQTASAEGMLPMEDPLLQPRVSEEPAEQPEEIPEILQYRGANDTVLQEYPTFLPMSPKEWEEAELVLPLPADTIERTRDVLNAQPNLDPTKTPEGQEWAENLREARITGQARDFFQSTVNREGGAWRQVVKSEKGLLGAAAPTLKEDTSGVKLTGDAAVLRVRALMGLGTIVQIPLWHSGFWITFKAPGDSQLLELHRRITEEKVSLGRATYGLAFANNSVFFAGILTDFALNHVYDTSLKNKEGIRAKISTLDIPLIVWGLACAIWPRGFPYMRSVLDQKGQPLRTIKERLAVPKLLWVDTPKLTPWQIAHMAQRHGNMMTDEAIQRYRDEFTIGRGREVDVGPNLKMTLKVPSLDEYLTNGQRWVNNIVAMVDRAFGMSQELERRDEYILNQGRASNMRQYCHWVERLLAHGSTIEQTETMDEIFDALSADDKIRKNYFDAVRKFMEDSTMAIIAVPSFEKEDEGKPLPHMPHLLPLDVLSTFFTLLVQRIETVVNRD